jgi:hypothetical protein
VVACARCHPTFAWSVPAPRPFHADPCPCTRSQPASC